MTGGSRGIGAGIAQAVAQEGARVAISYTSRPDSAEEVLAKLPGSDHFSVKMNLASDDEITTAFNQVFENFGTLHGLVNNAGITRDNLLLRMKAEDFDQVIQANLRGSFLCTKAVLKPMMKAKGGSIVNITSVVGQTGNAGQANYSASKAGLEAFSRSVALEFASRNIRSNCVAPGFIATEMTGELNEKQVEAILESIPMKSMGQPEDVAAAVVFLLSDEARYITGHTISVNGGMNM